MLEFFNTEVPLEHTLTTGHDSSNSNISGKDISFVFHCQSLNDLIFNGRFVVKLTLKLLHEDWLEGSTFVNFLSKRMHLSASVNCFNVPWNQIKQFLHLVLSKGIL